jgi:hypothetical protein
MLSKKYDPQGASYVEILEISRARLGLEKNSRDQEPRQQEEQIDAEPAMADYLLHYSRPALHGRRVVGKSVERMRQQHHPNGDGSNSIELRNSPFWRGDAHALDGYRGGFTHRGTKLRREPARRNTLL